MSRRVIDGKPVIRSIHGQPTSMGFFGKHLGYDYSCPVGTAVKAPVSGKVTVSGWSDALGNWIEITSNNQIHRIGHLSKRQVNAGQTVGEGQQIGLSGNTGVSTGPHVHHDVRKIGTAWNASFANYYDWEKMLGAQSSVNAALVGKQIQLLPVDTRTTFKAGTAEVAGHIRVTDNTFIYTVRGVDKKYPNRVIINSKSAGGDGVSLALQYLNGQTIPGWKKV